MDIIKTIRTEIERRQKENFEREGLFAAGTVVEDANILSFLDTLQEQAVKDDEIDFEQELYNRFGMVKDFTLGMRIAQCFYNLGKNAK